LKADVKVRYFVQEKKVMIDVAFILLQVWKYPYLIFLLL
jgi:hypothetical protein